MAINLTWIALSVTSLVVALGSLVNRWRHAETELRQRFKWVLYAFGVLLVVAGADLAHQVAEAALGLDLELDWPLNVVSAGAMVGLTAALDVAVLKLRLYDIDLVINRTIVYGLLTVVIVVGYVAVVAGVGALLPADETVLALVATGLVAVAFAPLRDRVQRWVNRMMFGQRDDPYAVLSELGRLVARSGTPAATLQRRRRRLSLWASVQRVVVGDRVGRQFVCGIVEVWGGGTGTGDRQVRSVALRPWASR